MDILEGTSLAFGRRAWAFLVGALGIGIGWAALTGNLRSGPPVPIAALAAATTLCAFAALFAPKRHTALYITLLATAIAALTTAGILIAVT